MEQLDLAVDAPDSDIVALDEALEELKAVDAEAAQLVKLRFFAGLKQREAAAALGLSLRTAERQWTFARAWLFDRLRRDSA